MGELSPQAEARDMALVATRGETAIRTPHPTKNQPSANQDKRKGLTIFTKTDILSKHGKIYERRRTK